MDQNRVQKVLIVDDEPDLLSVLGELFSLFGYEVLSADSGERAWAKLQANDVDVVLTDVRMPGMDGLDLVRKIRARHRTRPIVMMTSGHTDHIPEALYDAGANGFLQKPFGASGVRDAFVQASVPPERRWAQVRSGGDHISLRREMTELEVPGELTLGTGGMFWSLRGPIPRPGQLVDFSIVRPRGTWAGQGIVRWTRPPADGRPGGCGIEFLFLEDHCRAEMIGVIGAKSSPAFLPRN